MTVVKSDRQELRLEIQDVSKTSDKMFSLYVKTATVFAKAKGGGLKLVAQKLSSLLSRSWKQGDSRTKRLEDLCHKYIMTFKQQ